MEKSRRWPNSLGPCHQNGRPGWSSRVLVSAWPGPLLGCLTCEPADRRSLSLSLPLLFKQINLFKNGNNNLDVLNIMWTGLFKMLSQHYVWAVINLRIEKEQFFFCFCICIWPISSSCTNPPISRSNYIISMSVCVFMYILCKITQVFKEQFWKYIIINSNYTGLNLLILVCT